MGAIELLTAEKLIDLICREHFSQPALKNFKICDWPGGCLNLATGSVAGLFAHAEVNIGVAFLMGNPDDLFQTW